MGRDFYLSSFEAKEYGLIDRVLIPENDQTTQPKPPAPPRGVDFGAFAFGSSGFGTAPYGSLPEEQYDEGGDYDTPATM